MAREDWEAVGRYVLATLFGIVMGILAAFTWGYLMVRLLMETLFDQ